MSKESQSCSNQEVYPIDQALGDQKQAEAWHKPELVELEIKETGIVAS